MARFASTAAKALPHEGEGGVGVCCAREDRRAPGGALPHPRSLPAGEGRTLAR